MPQGQPDQVPADGLTTRQRRNRPLLLVHTGDGKGKSTAAFGLALRGWNQGWSIGVFQFVKSAKWRIGEQTALEALAEVHDADRPGRRRRVAQDGLGLVLVAQAGQRGGPRRRGRRGLAGDQAAAGRRDPRLYVLDEFTYPMNWGWVDVDDVVATLAERPGQQHVIITGRRADPKLVAAATLVTEMTKVKHPFDDGQKGQRGIEW